MQKARVINPDGKIIVQSKKDIKQSLDEEGEVEYEYFAFEGIEKGSIIEYIDLVLYRANLTGGTMVAQGPTLKKNVELELISPKHLEYQIFPINGMPDFVKDTTQFFHKRVFLSLDKVEALPEEGWSAYQSNIQKCYYKLNRNTESGKANFYTYNTVTKNIHEGMFAPLTKKEKSELSKFLKKLELNDLSLEQKVRKIENHIKKDYTVVEFNFENSSNIEFILSKKVMGEDGFHKLLLNCMRELDVKCELVVSCDRFENKFITEYEAYNFLKTYLLYINDLDMYVSHSVISRAGFVPEGFIYNNGLFIKEVKIGDLVTGVGKIKKIKGTDSKQSVDEIHTIVSFPEDMSAADVEIKRITSGYKAQPYQAIIDLIADERKEEVKKDYLEYVEEGIELKDLSFENTSASDFGSKPFIGKGNFSSSTFIERGGNNYLFKVGMLIGPQAEMYNRKKRVLPIETEYTREYYRTIEINIPSGYEIKNVNDLNLSVLPSGENGLVGFTSTYKVEGSKIYVTVKEWYKSHFFSVDDYPNYEKVMNAAADFNKIVLILQKK
jgi:hypothetical protein